jgi:hypothetical protein
VLMPQECPSCHADLADPKVPPAYAEYREQFSLVLTDEKTDEFVCPACRHRWKRGQKPSRRMRRQAQKALAKRIRKHGPLMLPGQSKGGDR